MPSDHHKELCRQLGDATVQIKTALERNDFEKLPLLIATHEEIMTRFDEAGDCKDPGLLRLLSKTKVDVEAIVKEIETRQAEIRHQLRVTTNKRKITAAYGS